MLIGNKIIFKNYKNYKILDIKKNLAIVQENYSNFYVRLLKDMLNSNIYKRIKILDLILFLEFDLKENKSFTPIQLIYLPTMFVPPTVNKARVYDNRFTLLFFGAYENKRAHKLRNHLNQDRHNHQKVHSLSYRYLSR